MKNTLICIAAAILSISCNRRDALTEALVFAGDNRGELERVLAHYSANHDNALKLKAAEFLITNMSAHFSYSYPKYLESYCNEIADSVTVDNPAGVNVEIMERISNRYDHNVFRQYESDLKLITAEYLIDNIERAFNVWQNGEWAVHLSFDDFCEYILPYKVSNSQLLDNWREYAEPLFKSDLDMLHLADLYKNSVFHASTRISKQLINLNKQVYPAAGINMFPIQKIGTLAKMPLGNCSDYTMLATAVMRSKGIPIAEDYTPQWPFQAGAHSWSVLLDNNFKNLIFSAGSSNPGEVHKPDEKMAKVFRQTFSINKEIMALQYSEKEVPSRLSNVCVKDVTDEYMDTRDIEMVIPRRYRGHYKYAYLAVFDNRNWIPIQFGKISGRKVKFEKMGKNCIYLPVFYHNQEIVPFDVPFRLSPTGEIVRHDGDAKEKQTIIVRRKYYVGQHCYSVGNRLLGGKFQAADLPDFKDSVTLYQIPKYTVQSDEFEVSRSTRKYRYWRYLSAKGQFNNMAELYFYQLGNPEPIYGKIIGTDGSVNGESKSAKDVVFDRDPLTYYDSAKPSGEWVGMDFGEPIAISRIAYTPRGDGNDITPGDTYELLYWQNNGWVSLGYRQANDIKLIYEDMPVDAVFWIRNHSRGKEERIFTYEDGRQVWW